MKNLRIVFVIALSVIFGLNLQAQDDAPTVVENPSFVKGQLSINLGVGIVPLGMSDGRVLGQPTLSADYAITNGSSIGAFFIPRYNSVEINREADVLLNRKKVIAGVRYLGHFKNIQSWDIYGGFQVGYLATTKEDILEKDYITNNEKNPAPTEVQRTYQDKIAYSPVLGFKYLPKNVNFGAFAELGFNGTSFGTAGLSYKF